MSREGARIDAGDAGDTVFLQVVVDGPLRTPVRRLCGLFTNHKTGDPGPAGLVILVVDAVIADQRVRHADDLAAERRIRADLLVARHGRREHNLAGAIGICSEALTPKDRAVGQRERRIPFGDVS